MEQRSSNFRCSEIAIESQCTLYRCFKNVRLISTRRLCSNIFFSRIEGPPIFFVLYSSFSNKKKDKKERKKEKEKFLSTIRSIFHRFCPLRSINTSDYPFLRSLVLSCTQVTLPFEIYDARFFLFLLSSSKQQQ